jgi:hypothetical protein
MARTKKDVTAKHRVKRTLDSLRLLRGFDRAAHFAAGGERSFFEAFAGRVPPRGTAVELIFSGR